MERRLNVKMKRSKKRCRLGVAIPDRLFCRKNSVCVCLKMDFGLKKKGDFDKILLDVQMIKGGKIRRRLLCLIYLRGRLS